MRSGMTTGAEGGRPKRSSTTVWSSVFGQVEPGSAPAGIRQAVNPRVRNADEDCFRGSFSLPFGDLRRSQAEPPDYCPLATSKRAPRARSFALRSARPLIRECKALIWREWRKRQARMKTGSPRPDKEQGR